MAFNRALIFFNPASTHASASKRRISELERLLGEMNVEVIETKAEGRAANVELLRKNTSKMDKNTIVGIAAGDGTTNQIIEALLTAPGIPNRARKVVILPLWGGNANDLAHMLNGTAYKARLKNILENGQVVPIHPLQCDLTSKGRKTKTHLAACYASLGVSAFAAKRLNKTTYRKSRLRRLPGTRILHDIMAVIGALMDAPSFAVKEHDGVRSVYELSFYNGSRMAKIERLPAKLTDEMFYLNRFENKRILSAIPRFIEMTRKGYAQNLLRNYASFTTQEESWAQFDGEPVKVPAHTKVQVQLSPRPFYALATVLKIPKKK